MSEQDQHMIHIVAGPTASGKSSYAMDLARQLYGIIINCDSLQIYNELPTLTAQPTAQDRQNIPHTLYSHLHPNEVCSAGKWREMAEPIIDNAFRTGQTPIIVGGSGLYIKALTDGLSHVPDIPENVRAAAIQKYEELGSAGFYNALYERDPIMAERFHPQHKARLIRAWEVLEATGRSLSEWQKLPLIKPPAHWRFRIHRIFPEREILRQRCDHRFLEMISQGVLDEVAEFQAKIESGEVRSDVPLTKALGFKSLRDHIKGKQSLDEAVESAQTETKQYAKRQMTWFRNQLKKT